MRWKPLVGGYRRHEAPGGILALERGATLSQIDPGKTDSRITVYLYRSEARVGFSDG